MIPVPVVVERNIRSVVGDNNSLFVSRESYLVEIPDTRCQILY